MIQGLVVIALAGSASATELDAKLFDEASNQIFKIGIATGIDRELQGHGTGFVVSSDGLVATAFHVVAEALDLGSSKKYRSKIYAVRKGVRVEATIWAVDSLHDMAIIKLPTSFAQPWKISSTAIDKGTALFLMGFPGEVDFAIVNGVLQSKDISETIPSYQITSPIKAGMSGGPVLTEKGEVVGMILASYEGKGDIALAGQSASLVALLAEARQRAVAPSIAELVDDAHHGQIELQNRESQLLKNIFRKRSGFNGWLLPGTESEDGDVLCGESDARKAEAKMVPIRSCQFKMATNGEEVSFDLSYHAIPPRSNQLKTADLTNTFLNDGRRWKRDRKKYGKFSCEPDVHLKRSDGISLFVSVCTRVSNPSMDVFHLVIRVASLDLTKPGVVGRFNLIGFTKANTKELVDLFLNSLEVDHEFEPEE